MRAVAFALTVPACLILQTSFSSATCPCMQPDYKAFGYESCDGKSLNVPTEGGLLLYNSTTYGSSCRAWENGWYPICKDPHNLPDVCTRPWCYVDTSTCVDTASYPTDRFVAMDLRWSYEACGDPYDSWHADRSNSLKGKVLRFAYPMEMKPWHYKVDGHWTGVMHRFFESVQARAGFVLAERNVSAKSRSMFKSKWDACIHDIKMGLIDICPTAAWETGGRWDLAAFTPPVLPSPLRLMVKEVESADPWNPMSGYESVYFSFMKPFRPELWLMVLVLTCCATTIVKRVDSAETFTEVRRSMSTASTRKEKACAGCCSGVNYCLTDMLESWSALFSGGALVSTTSVPGHVVSFGYIVLATIIMASYTANLATTLVMHASSHQGIQGFKDCDPATPGLCEKVCVATQLARLTQEIYPTMQLVTPPSSGATLKALADGECDAAIIPEHDMRARLDFQTEKCNGGFTLVGQAMSDMMVGIPISPEIVNSYSNHAMQLIYENVFDKYFEQFRFKRVSPDGEGKLVCSGQHGKSGDDDVSFKIEDLIGIFFLFFLVAGFALCWRVSRERYEAWKESRFFGGDGGPEYDPDCENVQNSNEFAEDAPAAKMVCGNGEQVTGDERLHSDKCIPHEFSEKDTAYMPVVAAPQLPSTSSHDRLEAKAERDALPALPAPTAHHFM